MADYLVQLDRAGETLPLNPDGGPNYSEIARHCGFGRQVFYTNEKARGLMEQAPPPFHRVTRKPENQKGAAQGRSPRPAYREARRKGRHPIGGS